MKQSPVGYNMICFVLSTFISLTPILPTFECIAMVALNADFQIQMYTIDPEIFANHIFTGKNICKVYYMM